LKILFLERRKIMIKRKASWTYDGIKEDEKEQKVLVPSKGKVDNTRGPLGYGHGKGEEDKEHGPGVTPNPDKTTGPGIGLTGATVDNTPSPVPRKR
jgi:hypothetical protein